MIYLIWTLPALLVIAAIASGRVSAFVAAVIGLAAAIGVGLAFGPVPFGLQEATSSVLRGTWIGWVVVPYILGGLLFWRMAFDAGAGEPPIETPLDDPRAKRRLLFFACFLIGPFAESATGFGVGIIGTMMLVRRLGVAPIPLLGLSLMSQTMIPWGAMGSGGIVAAAFARTDPTALTVHAGLVNLAFNACWLPLFWRMAAYAGLGAPTRELVSEAVWLGSAIGLVIGATALLGPETAMLAAYGPLIVLRYLVDERPSRETLHRAFLRMLPFCVLIGWLVVTRLVPPIQQALIETGRLRPFAGAPAWSPLFHAGSWLIVGAIATGLLRGHARAFPAQLRSVWTTGRLAVLSILTFSAMAETLSGSGIAAGLAQGMFQAFGRFAVVLMPTISAIYGSLANSGNAANGLFMASQVSLATEAGLNVAALIGLQHAAALSLNLVSPVRMSIVCSLAGTPGLEREAYRIMMPFAVATFAVIVLVSLLIANGQL